METKKEEKNEKTITGRIGKSDFKDLGDKCVLNLTVATGKDKENPEWQKVTLWKDLALEHKDLAVGSKITISGIEKSNPVEKDGKKFENKSIDAKSVDTYDKIQVEGIVGKVEEKKIGDKNLKEILVINNYKENGEDKSKLYNVALWNDAIGKAGEINVGDKIKIDGEARTNTFGEDKKKSVTINNPKEIEITPKFEKEVAKEAVKDKEVSSDKKQEKPKSKGMEM